MGRVLRLGTVGFSPLSFAFESSNLGPVTPAILIVDDDAGFRDVVRELLIGRGYEVAGEAATAGEARTAVAEEGPDGILLDVNLPDGDGVDLALEFNGTRPAMRILLTSTSEHAMPADVVKRSGAAGFVRKRDLVSTNFAGYFHALREASPG